MPTARRLIAPDPEAVIAAVAAHYGVATEAYRQRRSSAPGRDMAAYLAHRRTTATLRELAAWFGLSHPDSVSNLIRRAERAIAASKSLQQDVAVIDKRIGGSAD